VDERRARTHRSPHRFAYADDTGIDTTAREGHFISQIAFSHRASLEQPGNYDHRARTARLTDPRLRQRSRMSPDESQNPLNGGGTSNGLNVEPAGSIGSVGGGTHPHFSSKRRSFVASHPLPLSGSFDMVSPIRRLQT
jgi:hypothetical protein